MGIGTDHGDEHARPQLELVTQRLCSIVQAFAGRNVGANDDELWFEPERASGLQIRLGVDHQARCYDRSANFAISYGGDPRDEQVPDFADVVDRIKAIDAAPIQGFAATFQAAADAVVHRFAITAQVDGEIATGETNLYNAPDAALGDAVPMSSASDSDAEDSSLGREVDHAGARLNVIFLDLCSRLAGGRGGPLFPLHFGFWPTDAAVPPSRTHEYEALEAFSENLLSYVPGDVSRILDVGCGLGGIAKLLSARGKRVTALSPVAHHCAVIESAQLPGVDVRCARFEDLIPAEPYDLLLFAESMNHFSLNDEFLEHCKRFLARSGFMLMADDLTEERARMIEEQPVFRVVRSVDITRNVAPSIEWWAKQLPLLAAYQSALMSVLELHDLQLAARVRDVLGALNDIELRMLFSGQAVAPVSKGRYMIYLLQRD